MESVEAPSAGAETGASASAFIATVWVRAGIMTFWPIWSLSLEKLFAARNFARLTWFLRAIRARLSPGFTM